DRGDLPRPLQPKGKEGVRPAAWLVQHVERIFAASLAVLVNGNLLVPHFRFIRSGCHRRPEVQTRDVLTAVRPSSASAFSGKIIPARLRSGEITSAPPPPSLMRSGFGGRFRRSSGNIDMRQMDRNRPCNALRRKSGFHSAPWRSRVIA